MNNIMTIVSLALGGILLIGFLIGFLRSWRKSLVRFVLLLVCFLGALILSSKIAEILMNKYVNGLVLSIFGQTIDFEAIVGDMAGDLLGEGAALTNFATALLNIAVKLIAFLIIFISLMIVTLLIYYVIAGIMSSKQKKKAVGKVKAKGWERLIGGVVGIVGSLIVCLALFTPVFGVMNVCDKFLEEGNSQAQAVAYTDKNLVCGKFYTEDENIGKVETYLEKYDKMRTEYNKSFAGMVFRFTGVDALGKSTFNNLSTVKQNGLKVNFTKECVNMVNVYNIYKENFVETKFDITTEKGANALEKIYGIAKKSEVMRSVLLDIVPKMASKWTNGEKFLGMEIPVSGDMKEIVIEMLGAFNTTDFDTLDKNIGVTFEAIKIANRNDVISTINNGGDVMDVLGNGTFVEDEIKNLATSPEFKRALPNIMTTTIKIAYKSAISDPGTKLDQEFTQDQLAEIVWNNEAEKTQVIVSRLTSIFEANDILDSLGNFGVVLDASRNSKVLTKPVHILMKDYIELKVDGLGTAKEVILNAFSDENWNSTTFSYTDLFTTVQTTAKVAKDIENADLSDIQGSIESIIKNDTDGKVKETIKNAIKDGGLNDLIGDETKAGVFEDLITTVLDNTTAETIDKDILAGQVIVDIIANPKTAEGSILDGYGNEGVSDAEKADVLIETLAESDTVMKVMEAEANKGNSSAVKNYIDNLSDSDKELLKSSISNNSTIDSANKETLSKLFGITA